MLFYCGRQLDHKGLFHTSIIEYQSLYCQERRNIGFLCQLKWAVSADSF
jgi:hypothetical protein